MYRIVYEKQAVKDIPQLKAAKLDKKAQALIEILRNNPTQPPCEALVGNLSGLHSRRINIQHRLVYEIIEEKIIQDGIEYQGTVKIIRMWTHYDSLG